MTDIGRGDFLGGRPTRAPARRRSPPAARRCGGLAAGPVPPPRRRTPTARPAAGRSRSTARTRPASPRRRPSTRPRGVRPDRRAPRRSSPTCCAALTARARFLTDGRHRRPTSASRRRRPTPARSGPTRRPGRPDGHRRRSAPRRSTTASGWPRRSRSGCGRWTPSPNDDLDRPICDGDLLLQLGADHQDTVLHALRDITRHTRGGMQLRWRMDGFTAPPRPSGDAAQPVRLQGRHRQPGRHRRRRRWTSWCGPGTGRASRPGPPAAATRWCGSSGCWSSSGTGSRSASRSGCSAAARTPARRCPGSARPTCPTTPTTRSGATIPLDAHIRLANPRTAARPSSRILRRGYNYDRGIDANGNLDMGLVFTCFQQDLDRQFVAVQNRLADEPLVDYILPVGGGYFFALPGRRATPATGTAAPCSPDRAERAGPLGPSRHPSIHLRARVRPPWRRRPGDGLRCKEKHPASPCSERKTSCALCSRRRDSCGRPPRWPPPRPASPRRQSSAHPRPRHREPLGPHVDARSSTRRDLRRERLLRPLLRHLPEGGQHRRHAVQRGQEHAEDQQPDDRPSC